MKPFAGTLFAAVDGRLSGLTRRYACSLSVAWVTLERKLLTVSERPARRWRRSGRAAPRRSAIVLRPTSRWPQQCSLQKAAEPKETAESGSPHAPSDHGSSSGQPRPRGTGARSAPPLPQPRQAAHFPHARLIAPAVRAAGRDAGAPRPAARLRSSRARPRSSATGRRTGRRRAPPFLHGIAAPLARRRAAPPQAAELSSAAGCRQPTAQRGRLRRCSASPDTRREPGWPAPSRRGTLGTRSLRSTCVSISQPRPCPHRCSRGFAVTNPPAVSAARWSWKFGETPSPGTSRGCAVASDGCSLHRLALPTGRAALAPARK